MFITTYKPKKGEKILLALSGGMDSTITGWLLKQEGYELKGVYLQLLDRDKGIGNAESAADLLGIPLERVDLREEFHKKIIGPFIKAYLAGKTPNPCVICNPKIKCGLLFDWACEKGYSHLATGHYACIKKDIQTGKWLLLRGIDPKKDQSYFLYRLSQKQLSRLLLPLGNWEKYEVMAIAGKIGMKEPYPEESQEICFLASHDYRSFIKKKSPEAFRPGPIYDLSGKRVGTHTGVPCYTIGQRKGLDLCCLGPNYVIHIDHKKNCIYVGGDTDLMRDELIAEHIHRIIKPWPKRVLAQIRSTQPPQEADIEETETGQIMVRFHRQIRAISPGQSCVFYDRETCLGGGIIKAGQAPSL